MTDPIRVAARLASFLFHPLLFPTYFVLFLGLMMPGFLLIPPSAIWRFAGFVAVITFIFPSANLLMLKAFGSIATLEMKERRDRILPLVMIAIFYGVVTSMFYYKVSLNVNFNKVMLIVTALAVLAAIVTLFFKISIHSLAMGAALGVVLPLNKAADGALLYPLAVLIVLAGAVMSARLFLQAHTTREVGYGAAVGFAVAFLGMNILF